MSLHATVEMLSAYLDRELPESDSRQVEAHLEDCEVCRERFTGMMKVVSGLRHLERMAPPSTLGQVVARRVAFEGRQESLADRLESSLGTFERQSSFLALFGLIIALAIIILLFAQAVEKHSKSSIPVIFQDPRVAQETTGRDPQDVESRTIAGRNLYLGDGVWIEYGTKENQVRQIFFGSSEQKSLFASHPELAELESLGLPVVVQVGIETLRFDFSAE